MSRDSKILVTITTEQVVSPRETFYLVKASAPGNLPASVILHIQEVYEGRLGVEHFRGGVTIAHPHRFKIFSEAVKLARQLEKYIKNRLPEAEVRMRA